MKIQVSHGVHFKNFKGPLELQAIFFFVSILISTAIACFEALFIRLLAPSNICSTVQKTMKMYKLGGYKRQFRVYFKGALVHHQHHIHFIQVYFLSFSCIFNKKNNLDCHGREYTDCWLTCLQQSFHTDSRSIPVQYRKGN